MLACGLRVLALLLITVITLFDCACPPGPTPPGPTPLGPASPNGQALVVNMIPASLSGETNQDSEPFLAVHPKNPQLMVASSFTPNPAGGSSPTAPIFVSQDGGNTWTLNATVPSQNITADITHAFDKSNGTLYAGIMGLPGLPLKELRASDFTSSVPMTLQASRNDVDQPFVQAITMGNNSRVYVGGNDFNGPNGRTATVDVSLDGGNTFNSVRIERRNTASQNGPSVRPAVSNDGTVYAVFFGWRQFDGSTATSDVVVVRDDTGCTGSAPFEDLKDSDGLPGKRVVQNVTIPWTNAPTLGQERIGSTLSIAVDANNSATVYVGWGDRVGNGDIYTIHVRSSNDRGMNWSDDLRRITNATSVALAVAANGTVGLLYQQLQTTGTGSRWITHLEQTRNAFSSVQDTALANVPADSPPVQFLPYIGDYNFLLAVGDEFRGVFSANNIPDISNFPQGVKYQRKADFSKKTLLDGSGGTVASSIDPFYFRIAVLH